MESRGDNYGQRLDALDGLRGYAALVVVPYHTITGLRPDLIPFLVGTPLLKMGAADPWLTKLCLTILNGESAVMLFFVLSGFVLTRSIVHDLGRHTAIKACLAFAVRRILRIFPSLAACLIVTFVVINAAQSLIPGSGASYSFGQLSANLALIDTRLNGATWTLQIEMLAIPVLLAAGLLIWRCGVAGAIAALVVALIVTRSSPLHMDTLFLRHFLLYFIAGALAWALAVRRPEAGRHFVPWWAILAALMTVNQIGLSPTLENYVRIALAGWLVAVLATSASRVLQHPFSAFLGKISYSFYLWNVLFLNLLFSFRDIFPPWLAQYQALFGILLAIPVIVATAPLASLVYKHVELPGIALGKKLSDRILGQDFASREDKHDRPEAVTGKAARIEARIEAGRS